MNWYKQLENIELGLITVFFTAYLIYFVRMYLISKTLKTSFKRLLLKFGIRSIYFLLILISLLGPSFGNTKKEAETEMKDVLIAIDLSGSMAAEDVLPNRFRLAVRMADQLKTSLKNCRIGLIIFSEGAFIHCPLTSDRNAFDLFLNSLKLGLINEKGTDFSSVLNLALETFQADAEIERSKILVILSDGEDFSESSVNFIPEYKSNNIPIFTIAIGSKNGTYINSHLHGRVNTKTSPSFLTNLSRETNGTFYEASSSSDSAEQVSEDINSYKGKSQKAMVLDPSGNKYFYFLLTALFFIFMDIIITFNTLRI
ncbi:MAG: vWA domain-containing protein [Cytophagaceae bacterium]